MGEMLLCFRGLAGCARGGYMGRSRSCGFSAGLYHLCSIRSIMPIYADYVRSDQAVSTRRIDLPRS